MKIQNLPFLFFAIFFSTNIFAQTNPVQIPTHADGSPIICEKFELLEKNLPNLHLLHNNTPTINLPPQLQAQIRTDEDEQVGESGKAEFEIHAAVNPLDPSNIIVGAMSISGNAPAIQLNFAVYATHDFGATWQKSPFNGELPNELTAGGGDPMIAFDENGKAYFTWVMVTIYLTTQAGRWGLYSATSTNGGDSWVINGTPLSAADFEDFVAFSDLTNAVDKPWMVGDNSPSSNFLGNIYVTYVDIDVQTGDYNMKVKRRLAGSNNFEESEVIISTQNYSIAQFASIAVGKDGTVYASFLGAFGNDYAIYLAKSTDGGATFSTEQKISDFAFPTLFSGDVLVTGISEDRLYPCPHIVADPSDAATLYATWTGYGVENQVTDGMDIYLTKSTDGGNSWSVPQVVNDDSNPNDHQFYSSIAVNEDGLVFVSWYDQRNNAGSNNTHYYVATSMDGGASFDQKNVSSIASDFGQIVNPQNNNIGPGEYNQIVTTGDYAIPFWGDGRTNDGKISVYSAFLNLNGVDELKSLTTQFSFIGPKPNPVTSIANFELKLKEPSFVEVLLYDIAGKQIRTIVQRDFSLGVFAINFRTSDLAVGEYVVTVRTDFGFQSEKIMVVR